MDHDPSPDTWDCSTCGKSGRANPAQQEMLHTMTPTELRINQWVNLEQAVIALQVQELSMKQLRDRVFGWSGREPVR